MIGVQDLLRKLKPIIGSQADRLWLAFLAEDSKGRAEMGMLIQMLAAKHLGSDVAEPDSHLSAPSRDDACGEYALGEVVYANKPLHAFGLREEEWIQHTAIFGRSGAGKTNTVFALLEALLRQGKPFLIFDWKRNYRDLLAVTQEEIVVHTVGRDVAPFTFNPLIPPEGTDAAVWLKKLIEIIAHAYHLGEGVMFLLQEALDAVYRDFDVYSKRPETWPTFEDVLAWLRDHPVRGRQALWMDSTLRGVKSMCFGHMGDVVNASRQPNISALLERNVILELDGLTNADKTLITEALLLWIHHWRLTQADRETFKHAIIIEEAHHILLKRTGGQGGEAITDTILREIRELGEAIVLVDQHPSLISIPALGNTHTTIAMNLKHRSDVNAVGAAMLLEEEDRDILGRLPIGWAVVKLQSRWIQPFVIRIPHRKIPKGQVDDAYLRQRTPPRIEITAPEQRETQPESREAPSSHSILTPAERDFLTDVAAHHFSGTVERYRRLAVSRRRGNDLREKLQAKALITPVDIPTKSGRIVLVSLTDTGKQMLRGEGVEAPDSSRWGGPEHEYWKHRVAQRLQEAGWQVKLEEPVNGFTDIVAQRDTRRVAIEIETGKSDWQANLAKNQRKGFTQILIVATNPEAHAVISQALDPELESVGLWLVEDLLEHLHQASRA